MKRPAFGFYWTLPVPWAGFRSLPDNPNEAASESRTIRYQVERVRRYAKDRGYDLVGEQIFVELEPDRVSSFMEEALREQAALARKTGAVRLIVDFAQVGNHRQNIHLKALTGQQNPVVEIVPPDAVMIDGKLFDPAEHFSRWRQRQHSWRDGKEERIRTAVQRASELQSQKFSLSKIAARLNTEGLRSATGKPWTEDMLRKAFKNTGRAD